MVRHQVCKCEARQTEQINPVFDFAALLKAIPYLTHLPVKLQVCSAPRREAANSRSDRHLARHACISDDVMEFSLQQRPRRA